MKEQIAPTELDELDRIYESEGIPSELWDLEPCDIIVLFAGGRTVLSAAINQEVRWLPGEHGEEIVTNLHTLTMVVDGTPSHAVVRSEWLDWVQEQEELEVDLAATILAFVHEHLEFHLAQVGVCPEGEESLQFTERGNRIVDLLDEKEVEFHWTNEWLVRTPDGDLELR